MIDLKELFGCDLIVFLDLEKRDEVLKALINLLDSHGKLKSRQAFESAIFQREKIVTTGIGMGVAIPHAKLPGYEAFFIAVGVLKKGVLWDSLDGTPVRLVFMIGGPENQQTKYLQILSSLTSVIKNEKVRKGLMTASTPQEVLDFFI
jgi:PTS system nitrogen regulatory IIA component